MSVTRVVVDKIPTFRFLFIYVKEKFLVTVDNYCGFSRSYQQLLTAIVDKSVRKLVRNIHLLKPKYAYLLSY